MMSKFAFAFAVLTSLIVFSSIFAGNAAADITIRPAKLGIVRLTIQPLFPTISQGTFLMGNSYEFPLNVTLNTTTNVSKILSLSDSSFTLQPGENKTVSYTIKPIATGVFTGAVVAHFTSSGNSANVGYQDDIVIVVNQSDTYLLVLIAVAAVAVIVAASFFVMKRERGKGNGRGKKEKIIMFSLIPILILSSFSFLSFIPAVSATNVALAVANAQSLNQIHEQPILNLLNAMNLTVVPIDQFSNVNWSNFNLLVVAGRPGSQNPLPASFAANLPVNSIPTIAIDFYNLNNWGWVAGGGVNLMQSGAPQSLYVSSLNHPITSGYTNNQRVFFHNQTGLDAVDLVGGTSNFTYVAFMDQQGDGAIAFASPNTKLTGGKTISSNSVAVFLGMTWPAYWTSDAQTIFINTVQWVVNLNYNPPNGVTLSGPPFVTGSSATYSWNSATGTNGIQNYEIQVSTVPDFSTLKSDVKTASLSYSSSGLTDGTTYYVRVRSIDYLNLMSVWSNTVSTIVDSTPIILQIFSPSAGMTYNIGDNVTVSALVDSPKVSSGSPCTLSFGNSSFAVVSVNSSGYCSGTVTIPSTLGYGGVGSTNFIVSVTDSAGMTNSASVSAFFTRSLTASVTTDAASYSAGAIVTMSGYVKVSDNNSPVAYATVSYSVSGTAISGIVTTDQNGFFTTTFAAPSDGTYTITANITYNSASTSATAAFSVGSSQNNVQTASGGGTSFGGDGYGALLTIVVPNSLTGYENSDLPFTVTITNNGLLDAQNAKVDVNYLDIFNTLGGNNFFSSAEISPTMVNSISPGQTQNFSVTLHIPKNVSGTYSFKVQVFAIGAGNTKRVSLQVLPESSRPATPSLRAVSAEIPDHFFSGQDTTVNYTIANDGNADANAAVTITLPSGWTVKPEDQTQAIILQQGIQQKVIFHVTPSDQDGQIQFAASYQADGKDQNLTQSIDAKVSKSGLDMTGLFAFIGSPEFFIPALIVAGALIAIFYLANSSENRNKLKLSVIVPITSAANSSANFMRDSLANLSSSFSSSNGSMKYVWPRGGKGYFFNSLFGNGSAAAATQSSRPAARPATSTQARVKPANSGYEQWEADHHPSLHAKMHRKA